MARKLFAILPGIVHEPLYGADLIKTRNVFQSCIPSLAAVLVLSISVGAQASTLLMDTGPTYGTGLEGVGGPYYCVVVQPFTLNIDVENFEAQALLYPGATSVSAAKVFLTTQVGPGATAADVIATQIVPGSSYGLPSWKSIASASLLSAGNYYFVMQPEVFNGVSSYWWQSSANNPGNENGDFHNAGRTTSLSGGTNYSFPPASNFTYYSGFTGQTRIYGDVVSEPSSLILLAVFGAIAFLLRACRTEKVESARGQIAQVQGRGTRAPHGLAT